MKLTALLAILLMTPSSALFAADSPAPPPASITNEKGELPASMQATDPQATIARLAQPAQTSIDFTEIRFSRMLQQPLIVSGTMAYIGPQALDRHVTTPYREDSEIRNDSVSVAREGERTRTFALRRAPELQGLLTVFSALLAGDHASIASEFAIVASGNDQVWSLELTPRDDRLRERIRQIRVEGRIDTPQCFWMFGEDNSVSVTLLDTAARAELPQALTPEWLEAWCAM